jgi:hypothetical protein
MEVYEKTAEYLISGETIHMTQDTIGQFGAELTSFFIVTLFNLVFGALALAIGLQVIIVTALTLSSGTTITLPSLLLVATGVAGVIIGPRWIVTSSHILKGINGIRREYKNRKEPVTDEILTGWIVTMMAHYRENTRTIRWMNRICLLGGCIYFAFGLQNLYDGIMPAAVTGSTGAGVFAFALAAAAINCTIGIVSILFSLYFHRYSKVWDKRMAKAESSEAVLMHAMERE